jgi:hypothetical protein
LGRAGLFATLSALFLSVVSFAAAGIAVPDIGASLQATAAEQSLVVAIYALGFAVPLVLGGRLGDLYGRRRLFLIGMAGFTLSSLLATFAPTMMVLITARALMGISRGGGTVLVVQGLRAVDTGRQVDAVVAKEGAHLLGELMQGGRNDKSQGFLRSGNEVLDAAHGVSDEVEPDQWIPTLEFHGDGL